MRTPSWFWFCVTVTAVLFVTTLIGILTAGALVAFAIWICPSPFIQHAVTVVTTVATTVLVWKVNDYLEDRIMYPYWR